MGKTDDNKQKKKDSLFNTAYNLFITKGVSGTSISDIVKQAGVAKGTFYLYFKDKYDIKEKLVIHKTRELFHSANTQLRREEVAGLENQLIFIIDHIINTLKDDRPLLNFISKNLVMGALRSVLPTDNGLTNTLYDNFLELVRHDENEYNDIDVMLFTIIELAGSTTYNSVIYEEPLPIEEYKPFLYRTVKLIIESHIAEKPE